MSQFDSESYLKRIGLKQKPETNFSGLKALHNAQLQTVPFENFDVALGKRIDLAPEAVFNKIVANHRGGYCFEVNGLLLRALKHFGFNARPLLGRVHLSNEPTGRGHQLVLVSLEKQQWIVDAGFGSQTPTEPLPLTMDKPLVGEHHNFRLIEDSLYGIMLQIQVNKQSQWDNLYSFDLNHVCDGDINFGNHFSSTHPESIFVTSCIATRPIEGGVATLHNRTLKKVAYGSEATIDLEEGSAYLEALQSIFGISFKEPYVRLKPLHGQAG